MNFFQGDILKVAGFKNLFVIVSKNAFIRDAGVFHVCPLLAYCPKGPVHIAVKGKEGTDGVVVCEQMKLFDPTARGCTRIDSLSYTYIMDVSDTIQGIFEYD